MQATHFAVLTIFALLPRLANAQLWDGPPCSVGESEIFIDFIIANPNGGHSVDVKNPFTDESVISAGEQTVYVDDHIDSWDYCNWIASYDYTGTDIVQLDDDTLYKIELWSGAVDTGTLLLDFLWAGCSLSWPDDMDFYCGPRYAEASGDDLWVLYETATDTYEFHNDDSNGTFLEEYDRFAISEDAIYPHDDYHFCDTYDAVEYHCMVSHGLNIFLSLQTDPSNFTHMDEDMIVASGTDGGGWAGDWTLNGNPNGASDYITLTMTDGTSILVERDSDDIAHLTLEDALTIEMGTTGYVYSYGN